MKEVKYTPISRRADVVVAGGGIAGISAALAAARSGAKVLLIEKQCILGGLATSGLVCIYLPLCDGAGHQVSWGIAEELLHLSIRHGAQGRYPAPWLGHGTVEERTKVRFEVQFNPVYLALLTEELLLAHNVELLYDTSICGVHATAGRLEAVIVENKSGRSAVEAASFVDATGDADLFWYAGAGTAEYSKKNTLAAWYYSFGTNGLKLNTLGFADVVPDSERIGRKPLSARRFSGLDATENSEMICASHRAILSDILTSREQDVYYEPTTISTMPQLRMTRRLCGEYTLSDSENGVHFPTSIGMIGDWRKRGKVYEIPFQTLFTRSLKNLIGAGRCISVDDGMWDITRVIPACAVTGQAAGTAAALTDDVTTLDINRLQECLCEQKQKIHINV